jgi:protein-L-isoaspartate(D-aspartate) O-methyltransferase
MSAGASASVAGAEPPPGAAADAQPFMERYVRQLTDAGAIQSAEVERAFAAVERHRLLETFYYRPAGSAQAAVIRHDPRRPAAEHLAIIYADNALATRQAGGFPSSSTSQPSLMANMLEFLRLAAGMKILEIGAGTGYNAALMAELTGNQRLVVTLDVQEDVVEQTRRLLAAAGYPEIRVLAGDGADGAPDDAPFDRVVATVGCSDLSPAWAGQLREGGRMLIPLAHAGGHPLVLLRKEQGQLRGRIAAWTGFIPIRGRLHIEGRWERGIVMAGPGAPVGQRQLWPGFGAAGAVDSFGLSADEIGLLFFLGLHDRRACLAPGGVGLSAGLDGWAVADPAGIRWWKDASLADELESLYERWRGRGQPGLEDYEVSFTAVGAEAAPPPGSWQIERRFYREVIQLAVSGAAQPRTSAAG